MRDLVETCEAEERERLQQVDSERPAVEQRSRQPARARERRQHQGVEPDAEAGGEAPERASTRAALPEDAAQHHGRELGDRSERDEADRDQRVRLAGDAEVEVAEQEDEHDRPAPDAEQETGQVAARGQLEARQAQQHGHHQVVAHHRRQRDRFDDHHAGGRRQPADEHQHRKQLLLFSHRQRQDERVGVDRSVGEVEPAAERDRQHEDVDRQHVDGEQPDRLQQVLLVDVLDDCDLELARQEHDRQHRQHGEPHPARVAAGNAFERRQQRCELRSRGGAREDVAEAVVDPEGDERPDGEEREKLHQRLEGDRGHHAFVVLCGVQVPGAEGDREQREDQRDPERRVPEDGNRDLRRHDDLGVLDEDRETAGHGFQLQ